MDEGVQPLGGGWMRVFNHLVVGDEGVQPLGGGGDEGV